MTDWARYCNAGAERAAPAQSPPQRARVLPWVKQLLERREGIEKAIGMLLGEILGCGHWGCALRSKGPWVIKLTRDPTEGPMWAKLLQVLYQSGYGAGHPGLVRVRGLYELVPQVRYRMYAIVREEVEPAFDRAGDATSATRERIQAVSDETRWNMVEHIRGALLEARDAARWGGSRTQTRYQAAAYELSENPHARHLGELMLLLQSEGILLRDVHLGNVGWRVHGRIAGFGTLPETLVVFDPGHTPVERDVPIKRRAYNPGQYVPYWQPGG